MRTIRALYFVVLITGGAVASWYWFFCRFYVPPDHMAILIAKTGQPLPPGQILAKPGQQGIQEEVLGEGRYFYNPFLFEWKIVPIVQIPPGKVGIVISKVGADLPQGEFLAEPGQKGVWKHVLGPGKYRMNPYAYEIQVVDAVSIPIGYVGVVTSLAGDPPPPGRFAEPGQKGVRANILQPGLYFVNRKAFRVDVLEVGLNQVSLLGRQGGEVLTKRLAPAAGPSSRAAEMRQEALAVDDLAQNILKAQQERRQEYADQSLVFRGVVAPRSTRGRVAPPAPAQAPAEAQKRAAPAPDMEAIEYETVFVLNQFVTFPSRDGFEVSLDMTVEFELLPEKVAAVFNTYGDLPAVVEKALLPQILSVSRLKGSAYKVTDFIVGEGRERFQLELREALAEVMSNRNIVVHSTLIRHVNVPPDILTPIREGSIAIEQDKTNRTRQETARKQAELNTELALIEQSRAKVAQETEKLVAEIRTSQEFEVARIAAETHRAVAEIEARTAELTARSAVVLGEARAWATRLVEGETARRYELNVSALGDPDAYTLWRFASELNPGVRVRVIHAGPGTLWTDLSRATLGDLGGGTIMTRPVTPPSSPAATPRSSAR